MNAARPVAATLQTCQCCGVVPRWGGIGRRVQIRHRLPIWGGYRACVADALLGIDGKLEEQNKILVRIRTSSSGPTTGSSGSTSS